MELYFRGEKMAKVMGSLAMKKPEEGMPVSGEVCGMEDWNICVLVKNCDI